MTNASNLGRLKKVNLRDVWTSESGDFTPWLAQDNNLQLLGDAVDIKLELEAQEKSVGPFRADILCRNAMDESCVLIENQLERTDHSHLGQVLTYAAGLDAVSIIWIAERFTEEHRAAVDWLNEQTPDGINFFGLEVELWRIGESHVAPKFNVVCKPNGWTRSVIRARADNVRPNQQSKEVCLDYWNGVFDQIRHSGILVESAKPYGLHNTLFDVNWHKYFWLKAHFSIPGKKGSVWFATRGPNGLDNYFKIKESRQEIDKNVDHEIEWNENRQKNYGSIDLNMVDFDVEDRSDWPRQHKMYADRVISLYRAIDPYVRPLGVAEDEVNEP